MSRKGVHIEKGEPVERLNTEGPLDQNLTISVDHGEKDIVFLDSVTDENDVFERCPVIGEIDGDKITDDRAIRHEMEEAGRICRNIYLNPSGKGLEDFGSGVFVDKFAVSDAKWIDSPEELAWKSALLAQLQAKHNAVTHFLNDPSVTNFSGQMTDEDKRAVAQRARQLAAELQDAALNEIQEAVAGSQARLRHSVQKTKERLLRYVVTQEDAIKKGGLTESEVNELFDGGGSDE
jgi:hypothetical protein